VTEVDDEDLFCILYNVCLYNITDLLMSAPKMIVFDLDETLGYFTQINILWESVKATGYHQDACSMQQLFNDTMNLYPEVIRPDIQRALKYVYDKKCKGKCDKIMIYTNNKRDDEWVSLIANYFKYLLGIKSPNKLFDQLIYAFKINGTVIEMSRTTRRKTHYDLISCTRMPPDTQICFLDDSVYEKMHNINVYYINFEPYIHHISWAEMVRRFCDNEVNNSRLIQNLIQSYGEATIFSKNILSIIYSYDFTYVKKHFGEYEMERVVTKRIVEKIKLFFKISDAGGFCGRFVKASSTRQYSKKRVTHNSNNNKTKKRN
jgi:hypothetical protein